MENNLEIDVKNAKALGLSYGQYKAMQYDPHAAPIKKPKGIRCPVCGGVVKPPQRKYCSKECMNTQIKENKRQYSKDRYYSKFKCFEKEGD